MYEHKFKIKEELKAIINQDLINEIENISLPEKIVMLKYDLLVYPEIIGNHLILGTTKFESTKNYFYIDLNDYSVNHKWNYSDEKVSFINSSLKQLLYSLISLDLFINDLIENNEFGEYNLFHERYAKVLERLLKVIDEKCIEKGAWGNLLEEMKLGVI
jgi:hypothetical protein